MSAYHKPKNIIPADDEERLNKLYAYEILDTPAEITFDKIAALAALIFNRPIAQINFVDKNRVFLKADLSPLETNEIDREDSFCSLAILSKKVTLFEDTLKIPDLQDKKFVSMENGIRFYAGAPLKTREGFQIGTVCVLDYKPGQATADQLKMLESLSEIVIDELELRLAARKAVRIQTDMVNRIVHDLKNPNTTIKLSAELIRLKSDNPKMVNDLAVRITSSAANVLKNLNELLDLSQMEDGNYMLQLHPIELTEILNKVKRNFELVASGKNQTVTIICAHPVIVVSADASKLQEIFENLLSNALKYSNAGTEVKMICSIENEDAVIEIKDKGLGLSPEDMGKLFTKFARLSSVPTGKEHSNGLGLFLVKTMIELHKGKVWATSKGKNKGSSFFVSLPLSVQF